MLYSLPIALLALAHTSLARPGPPPAAFQVTSLNTFEPSGRPGDGSPYSVAFHVADPNDASTTFCEARWAYADAHTGYPSDYLANCTDPEYAFKFVDYNFYYDFELDVKHDTNTTTTRSGRGHVNDSVIMCKHASSGFSVCNQRDRVEFPLAIYNVEGKRH